MVGTYPKYQQWVHLNPHVHTNHPPKKNASLDLSEALSMIRLKGPISHL